MKLFYGLLLLFRCVCTPALFNKAISDKIGSYSSWECWFYRTINQKGMCDIITISLVWGVNRCVVGRLFALFFFCKTLFFNFILFKGQLVWHNYHFFTKFEFFFHLRRMNASFLKFYYFFAFSFWKPWQYDTVLEVVVSWMCVILCKNTQSFGLKQVFFSSWWKLQSQLRAQKVFFTLLLLLQGNFFSWEHFHFCLVEGVFFLKQAG